MTSGTKDVMTDFSDPSAVVEPPPPRRDPIVLVLAIQASMAGVLFLTFGFAGNLLMGTYGVFRLVTSDGLLRRKRYGSICERIAALLWIALAFLVLLAVVGHAFDRPRSAFVASIELSGIVSVIEFWYLSRAVTQAGFARRREEAASLSTVTRILWIVAPIACSLALALALPTRPTISDLVSDQSGRRARRTMADLRTIAAALEARAMDVNEYPLAASIDALTAKLAPTYVKEVPLHDGWSNAWRYAAWKADPKSPGLDTYIIISAGKDGLFEQVDPKSYKQKATTNFDCDIVFSNGAFVQSREGPGQ